MKICPNCGNQVQDDATFCNNCGTTIVADNANNAAPAAGETAGQPQGFAQQPYQNNYQQAPYGQPGYPQAGYPAYAQPDLHDHTGEMDPADITDNKLFAVIPYVSLLLGFVALMCVRDSKFVKFHLKNAIRIEICTLILCLLFIIPVLGWFLGGIGIAVLGVFGIIEIVWTFQGKAKDVPVIGGIKFLK